MKYDDASWHYGGEYPKELPPENAATAIGMFLAWCLCNGFASDELKEDCQEDIDKVILGNMTGAQFLIYNCDEKFTDSDLSETGQLFANDYYMDDSIFAREISSYSNDFCDVFNEKAKILGFRYKSVYHVEDTKENYDLISTKIEQRFKQWESRNRRSK